MMVEHPIGETDPQDPGVTKTDADHRERMTTDTATIESQIARVRELLRQQQIECPGNVQDLTDPRRFHANIDCIYGCRANGYIPDPRFDGLRRVFEPVLAYPTHVCIGWNILTQVYPGALAGAIGHAVDELEAAGAIHTSQPPKKGLETLWWDVVAHATDHDDPATLRALVKALEVMKRG